VIYIGTFSKVLFPALRLGYLVVPPALVDVLLAARRVGDLHPPALEQAVVADFMHDGHFARHIRRMRTLYAERGTILRRELARELSGTLEVNRPHAGLHLIGWLPPGIDDRLAAGRAAAAGIETQPVSHFAIERPARGGLLLGYAACDEAAIRDGVRRLAGALASLGTAGHR